MPKTTTKKKKDQGELVVRTPSQPFYKAFIVPNQPVETIVDVSGDTFSYTMEEAVLAALYKESWEKLCEIPMSELFIQDQEVDIDMVSAEHIGSVVLMAVRATYDAEFEAGLIQEEEVVEGSKKPKEFMFRMKALTEGYGLGIQDYSFETITIRKPKTDGPEYVIEKCVLRIDDVAHKNAAFPDTLVVV